MTYGVICFATLFSFVGTVLGGIWADQSWGRFWGWDPKENGALLIVLWNAAYLHVRWGGLLKDRGLMSMAIFGNVITAWSWFGTNMLGIGLHSYGFMDAAFVWLMIFIGTQVAVISLAAVPLRYWASFRARGFKPDDSSPLGGGRTKTSPAGA
jgi:cytochrome c biogenesis factor